MGLPGIYYLTNKPSQLTSIQSLYRLLGGTVLTWRFEAHKFFNQWRPFPLVVRLWPKPRQLEQFREGLDAVLPNAPLKLIPHFWAGPYPPDTRLLVCVTMWPIPPRKKRKFPAVQFYHGTSDKRYKVGGQGEAPPAYDSWDYWLLPGDKDREKLKRAAAAETGGPLRDEQLVVVGNLRFDKIINKDYDLARLRNRAGIPANGKKTILFAPTWNWGGGTLMSHYRAFCDALPPKYNLIIRNHINDLPKLDAIRAYCRQRRIEDVYFVNDLIMPITDNLILADVMIADTSSVAYDFLIMNRPLILNKTKSADVVAPPAPYDIRRAAKAFDLKSDSILDLVDACLKRDEYGSRRRELLDNCFYKNDGRATLRAAEFIRGLLEGGAA